MLPSSITLYLLLFNLLKAKVINFIFRQFLDVEASTNQIISLHRVRCSSLSYRSLEIKNYSLPILPFSSDLPCVIRAESRLGSLEKMIAATIYLSRGVQSLKHMFLVIVRAVLLSGQGYEELVRGEGGRPNPGEHARGANLYIFNESTQL